MLSSYARNVSDILFFVVKWEKIFFLDVRKYFKLVGSDVLLKQIWHLCKKITH